MNGILIIDKPQEWTSHDVVGKLRGILHERRIGHSGTLDPMATGVLVVFVGRATRAVEFAENHDKEYLAGIRFGLRTDSQDITGNILEKTDILPQEDQLRSILKEFCGEIEQIPPMYSAVKINGQKMYQLARRGQEVTRLPKKITVYDLELVGRQEDDYLLKVVCSKGTYVRTLCDDIGRALGSFACMSSLRRIRAGQFSIDESHTLEQIADKPDAYLLPVDILFKQYTSFQADAQQEKMIRNGNRFRIEIPDGTYRFYSESGEFLMLGEVKSCQVRTIKSFFEVNNL